MPLTLKNFNKAPLPPLNFTANTAWSTVQLKKSGTPTSVTLETSTDKINWSTYTFGTDITLTNIGDKVYFRNTSETDTGFNVNWGYYTFVMTWSISAGWDTTSLLNKNWTTTVGERCLQRLFYNCSSLTTAPSLPATTLANNCYEYMFQWCTSLTVAPELPATTLYNWCYWEMFYWCTSLTTPPELPATTLAEYCYSSMFYWCTALETVPSLPATTLVANCYTYMFQWCTALKSLPKLYATTLPNYCYYYMFRECTNIKLSTSKTWIYQTAYRIPFTWTGTAWSNSLWGIISWTGWTYTSMNVNTTYYTSNTLVW